MRSKVLLVGRDDQIRAHLARSLMAAGYGVEPAADGDDAVRLAAESAVSLAVVVGAGFERDGVSLVEDLRGLLGPVLLIEPRAGSNGAGTISPTDTQRLLAQVRECLVQPAEPEPPTKGCIHFGGFVLDLDAARLLDASGADAGLARGQLALLRALVTRPGRVLSREFLSRVACSTGAEPYERGIDMTVMRVRRRIEADPKQPRLIVTVPGLGYRFDPPLETVPARVRTDPVPGDNAPVVSPPANPIAAIASSSPTVPDADARTRAAAARPLLDRRRLMRMGLPAAGLLGAAAMGAALWPWRRAGGPPAPGETDEGPALVVLPFATADRADQTTDYLGTGIAREITVLLSTFPALRVMSASSVPDGTPSTMRAITAALNAQYAIEGSVERSNGGMHITAQLVRVATGENVWASRFDATGSDPLALQYDIADRIYDTLAGFQGRVGKEEERAAWRRSPMELSEFDYYLRGYEYFWDKTLEGHLRARSIWQEGLAKFPQSALLHNKIAWTYLDSVELSWTSTDSGDIELAWQFASKALAIPRKPRLVVWLNHWIMSALYEWHGEDFERSVESAHAAVALVPYDAHSRGLLAFYLGNAGELEQAIAWSQWAIRHNPGAGTPYRGILAWALYLGGRYDESRVALSGSEKDFPMQNAALLVRLDRLTEAREVTAAWAEKTHDTVRQEALWPLKAPMKAAYLDDIRRAGLPES